MSREQSIKMSATNLLKSIDKYDMIEDKLPYRPPRPHFVPIVINGKLAFKFDPERGLIEWQHRGEKHVIDLSAIPR